MVYLPDHQVLFLGVGVVEHLLVAYLVGVLVGDQVGAFLKEVLVEAQGEGLGVLNLGEVALDQVVVQAGEYHLALTFLHVEVGYWVAMECLGASLLPLLELSALIHGQITGLVNVSVHCQQSIASLVLTERDHLSHRD